METTWKKHGKRSPAHTPPPVPQAGRAEHSARPTYELADGVVRAGHRLDLSLQHSLPLSWERGKAMLGKAAVHFSTHLLTHGGQGFLQVKGARKHEVQCNCIRYSLSPHFLKINHLIRVAVFIKCNGKSIMQIKPIIKNYTIIYTWKIKLRSKARK